MMGCCVVCGCRHHQDRLAGRRGKRPVSLAEPFSARTTDTCAVVSSMSMRTQSTATAEAMLRGGVGWVVDGLLSSRLNPHACTPPHSTAKNGSQLYMCPRPCFKTAVMHLLSSVDWACGCGAPRVFRCVLPSSLRSSTCDKGCPTHSRGHPEVWFVDC